MLIRELAIIIDGWCWECRVGKSMLIMVDQEMGSIPTTLFDFLPLGAVKREPRRRRQTAILGSSIFVAVLLLHLLHSGLEKLVLQSHPLDLFFKLSVLDDELVLPNGRVFEFYLQWLHSGLVAGKVWAVAVAVALPDHNRHSVAELAWVKSTY